MGSCFVQEFADDALKEKNGVTLTQKVEPKVESLTQLKFDTGFRVIGEYLSQIGLILRVKLII